MATFIYGRGRAYLITGTDVVDLPANIGWIVNLGQGALFGIPTPIVVAAAVALIAFLFPRYTKPGRFIYAIGDNPRRRGSAEFRSGRHPRRAARHRRRRRFHRGIVTATSAQAMNTRVVNSNMIYDVILVVVLEESANRASRGNVRNVIVGSLLIGAW